MDANRISGSSSPVSMGYSDTVPKSGARASAPRPKSQLRQNHSPALEGLQSLQVTKKQLPELPSEIWTQIAGNNTGVAKNLRLVNRSIGDSAAAAIRSVKLTDGADVEKCVAAFQSGGIDKITLAGTPNRPEWEMDSDSDDEEEVQPQRFGDKHLRALPATLNRLSLENCDEITPFGVSHLNTLPLKSLEIDSKSLSKEKMQALALHPSLEEISFGGWWNSSDSPAMMRGFLGDSKVNSIRINSPSDEVIDAMAGKTLTRLGLDYPFNRRSLPLPEIWVFPEKIGRNTKLNKTNIKELSLTGARVHITADCVNKLMENKVLTSIQLERCFITPDAMGALARTFQLGPKLSGETGSDGYSFIQNKMVWNRAT